jgi:mono/diheme cytochrome c family protein
MIPICNIMRSVHESMLRRQQFLLLLVVVLALPVLLSACSMGEEMRRIEESKQAGLLRAASRTTNLTGEQIFVRSCNTCHPGGKQGMGPRLDKMDIDFPADDKLKKFIRKGKGGIMPPQPASSVNDEELNNLVLYLRSLNAELKDSK